MKIKKYRTIKDIKNIWENLYNKNKKMTIFQSYEWNLAIEYKISQNRFIKYRNCKLVYYLFNEQIIAPMLINFKDKKISIIGSDEMSDYLSFIFSELDVYLFRDVINFLVKDYIGFTLELDKINQNNPMSDLLISICNNKKITKKECVSIDLSSLNNVSENRTFYNTLSKSVRQNYRTAKNKLSKNMCSYNITVNEGLLNQEKVDQLYDIYIIRREDCRAINSYYYNLLNRIRKFSKILLTKICLYKDFDILSFYSTTNPIYLAEIYINNEVAAYYEGFFNNERNVLSIIRVATNKKFYKFSPGLILLIDSIDSISKDIDYFDLTRGNEDYKFKLNGKVHYNYKFEIID